MRKIEKELKVRPEMSVRERKPERKKEKKKISWPKFEK